MLQEHNTKIGEIMQISGGISITGGVSLTPPQSLPAAASKLVVGAYRNDDSGDQSGSIYLFDVDGTNELKVVASDAQIDDKFGFSVDISSNKIAVGAPRQSSIGKVYVYDHDGSNQIKITQSDGQNSDDFGMSVAINSTKVIVGAHYDDDAGTSSGSVYVYDLDGSNETKIVPSDAALNWEFGLSVGANESKIVGGAYSATNSSGVSTGAIYVYDLNGSNELKITPSDATANKNFGYTVAVTDSKIIVGARYDSTNATSSGAVYVYDLDGSNEVKILGPGVNYAFFGDAIASNGSKIVVGSKSENKVYVYNMDGTGEYTITPSDGINAEFGYSVSISDAKIAVGAWADDVGVNNSGSVYIYDIDGSNEVKITASDKAENDLFGNSVSII